MSKESLTKKIIFNNLFKEIFEGEDKSEKKIIINAGVIIGLMLVIFSGKQYADNILLWGGKIILKRSTTI